jgi:hypothetical protein
MTIYTLGAEWLSGLESTLAPSRSLTPFASNAESRFNEGSMAGEEGYGLRSVLKLLKLAKSRG